MTMILTYIETRDGKIKKSSLEALSEAKRRADEMGLAAAAVLIGRESAAPELHAYGAATVYVLENPSLDAYSAQGHAIALADLVRETKPKAFFLAASAQGKDLAPRLAARLGVSMASDCIKIAVENGGLVLTRPIYAGKALLTLALKTTPALVTLRPNVFPLAASSVAGAVIKKSAIVPEGAIKGQVVEVLCETSGEIDVAEADIIVSGGRGLKAPENFALLRDLAAILPKAAVGASRAAVDAGWIGHAHQVGQTGKTVSPGLYLAFGVSGAIQHLAGMSSSKVIVAVNKDPEAPIFKFADYGIVGDLFQVIPALKDELRKALQE
jgi:electron transfer flavoprotein alpha subunit